MARRSADYGLLNLRTGEVLPGGITLWQSIFGGKFVRVFQDAKRQLMDKHPELHGQTLRVLAYLEAYLDYGNKIPPPVKLILDTRLSRPTVYRAYAELKKAKVIIKHDSQYYLSPNYCWKGTEQQLRLAYETTFKAESVRMLKEARENYAS